MKFIIVLALIGAALAVPSKSPLGAHRIVGGEDTTIDQYPFMSNMQINWWGIIWYQACGGSLITPTTVLSAAHCYYGDHPSSWRVILGTTWAETGGTTFSVQELVVNAGYSPATLDNDIAIIRLASPALLSNNIATVRIAGTNYNLPEDTILTAIGWGALWSNGPSSDQLQRVNINIINQQVCAERYAYLKTQPGYQNWPDITNNMLCAGILNIGGKDACQGDSGGPLVHNGNVLVGITSWGFGCADAFYPGVNTRVSQYKNWILTNAQ